MSKNKSLPREIFSFIKRSGKWWLIPVIVVLIVLAVLIILGQASPLSPFIYTII
jgi:uncharacterized membrane protein YjdF